MIPISRIATSFLQSSRHLRSPAGALILKRHLKGERMVIRDKIPRYKLNLANLPELTLLLTDPKYDEIGLEDALELRRNKLAVYKEYLPANTQTNLLEAIFHEDNDVDRLLRIIKSNLETMSSFYVAISFEALDDMMRVGLCDKATVAVAPEFKDLCTKALYKMRYFETDEIIKVLKCLSTLELPGDSLLVQALLQMARHFIDDYLVDELECLERNLRNFSTTQDTSKSLLIALSDAIPIAIKKKYEEKQYPLRIEPPLDEVIPESKNN